jgi:hypothetical protein
VIEPVAHADWAAPVVAVLKKGKETVLLRGDYNLTFNKAVKLNRYPIPRIEDIFAKMAVQSILKPRLEANLSTAAAR